MSSSEPIVFDEERAKSYDDRFAKLAPMRDALHFLTQLVTRSQRDDARVLCVGAGTGAELIALARAFPAWRFTAVEPAPAMLDVCRQRCEAEGISSRCTLHEGYLDSLSATDPFDVATCMLVSHFLTDRKERHALFRGIASRLREGGMLVSADLSFDPDAEKQTSLLAMWTTMLQFTGMDEADTNQYREALERDVAPLPPKDVEAIIESAGFGPAVPFFQTLLIRAWYAQRSATKQSA
jgi:tRNA (cmo5U34)-methyltransferase